MRSGPALTPYKPSGMIASIMNPQNKTQSVKLRPMSESEYQTWLPLQIANYADSKIKAGNWPSAGALNLAQKQTLELLPNGLNSTGHLIYSIVVGNTQVVGSVWIKLSNPATNPTAFLYNIAVAESWRGRGYGTAALKLLEERLRREGVRNLQLHVFGYNLKAQRLYQRLGFEITNINMAKHF